MKILSCLIVIIFSIIGISASESSIKDVQRLSYGLQILPSYSLHRADMLPPKPMSICCPNFTEGQGLGYDVSLNTKYVLDYHHSISASFGYRDIGARLMNDTYGIVNANNQEAIIRSTLETALSMINIQCMYHWTPFHRFDFISGLIMGINASKNYTYQENIISSNVVFDNGMQQRNTSIGALTGINPRYFGLILGASYRLPISDALFIKPLAQYTYALRPIQFGTNWYADALTIGIGFEYFPFGEIEKPNEKGVQLQVSIIDRPMTMTPSISITENKEGIIRIGQNIHYLPMLDIVYPELFQEEASSNLLCLEDNGSCHYPWLMDTIAQRMKNVPDDTLQIHINGAFTNFAKQIMEFSHSRRIDTTKLLLQYSQDQSSQVYATLKADTLLRPYVTITQDSTFNGPIIQFTIDNEEIGEFEWGLYDNSSESIIQKGKGSSNQKIIIDSIPIGFRNGIVRCLVTEHGQKSLIQSNVTMNAPDIRISDPKVFETAALFELNKDSLRQIDIQTLMMFRDLLSIKDTIIIEAFTDLSGDITLNTDLSRRRANAVATFFPNQPKEIILSPQKARNSGRKEYLKAYNRIVTVKRKQP